MRAHEDLEEDVHVVNVDAAHLQTLAELVLRHDLLELVPGDAIGLIPVRFLEERFELQPGVVVVPLLVLDELVKVRLGEPEGTLDEGTGHDVPGNKHEEEDVGEVDVLDGKAAVLQQVEHIYPWGNTNRVVSNRVVPKGPLYPSKTKSIISFVF